MAASGTTPVTHLHRPLSSLLPWQVSGKMLLIPRKLLCEGKHRGMICHVYPGSHGELTFQEAIARSYAAFTSIEWASVSAILG